MRKLVFIIVSTLLSVGAFSQIKSASSFFPKDKAQVLIVGTFHFDYPGLDGHKTSDDNKIDVLQEPKKSEVTELVAYIKKFKPTKIVIEAWPSWNAGQKLRQYKEGKLRDQRDERVQLGLRVASELKMDTIYSIDMNSLDDDLNKLDTNYFKALFQDFDFQSTDSLETMLKKWLNYEDLLVPKIKLLDYIKRINSREHHLLGYGAYLIGDFKLSGTRGPDILSIWWYNRNLRIFRRIQEITTSPKDRIMVIYGNGHAAILRQLFECSPEYHFVEFGSLK